MLSLLLLMPTFLAFVGIFFLFGMAEGLLDINMNEQAVLIEREYQRPIMSSFHAVFSGGMALGAGCGVWMSHAQIALWQHFGMVAALGLFLAILVSSHFVPVQVVKTATHDQPLFLLPSKAILPLGIIAFCCMTGEGAMADWSAVYMKQILEQSDSFAGFALASFNAAMLIGRSIGDALTRFFGKKRLLLLDSAASALGLIMVLAIPNEWSALVGFFIIGLGLSTIVPIVYSAAGNTPGVKPSTGIAMATSVGYAGFFVGPPVIGFLAEAFDLRIGMLFTLLLFLVMWGMVQRYRV
jgi:fucose permease